jgi:Fe2+ transport system protein B
MAEELGKIEKPSVEEFKKSRKLYFIPLILTMRDADGELNERINKYWEQVESHLANLEAKLGRGTLIFHELIAMSGDEGLKTLEMMCEQSHRIAKSRVEKGAHLQAIEDAETLMEYMDWSRCLAIGMQSQKAFTEIYEKYSAAQKQRNETIAKKIDEVLLDNEIGIIMLQEGHKVQFPEDIQLFYISPPELDELKRWLREREEAAEKQAEQEHEHEKPEAGK